MLDFSKSPLLVFWETTKACTLSCRHCRASAISKPLPDQLDYREGVNLIADVASFGDRAPVLVLTGGDCLMRGDIRALVEEARSRGLHVALSPAVSPLMSDDIMAELYSLGVRSVSISLDGSTAAVHDRIRGIDGHFKATLSAAERLVRMGFAVQVNTTVMRENARELADIALILKTIGIKVWEVFFLVTVGRGRDMQELTPAQNEDVCNFLADMTMFGFIIRTVEAPFYRRVLLEREKLSAGSYASNSGPLYSLLSRRAGEILGKTTLSCARAGVSTRDGSGIIFVSQNGDVYPSGFLPYPVGNIRSQSLVDMYRNSEQLLAIRNGEFKGRCGICEYRERCGGSRARAFAHTGDIMAEDPGCPYNPATV